MSKTMVYLIYFTLYSFIILIIGKSSYRDSNSLHKFFVGERKLGVLKLFFTFVGTWISAATILGFTGNVYENGVRTILTSVIPWFIGAGMLYLISSRLYDNDVLTIPQLIRKQYNSRGLQIMSGLLMAGCYVFYLVIQIKGFGIAAASLLNIDYKVAVFLVYLFILYSTFGGFQSVTKTDTFNLIMLTISMVIIYFVIIDKVEGAVILTDRTAHISEAAGSAVKNASQIDSMSVFTYITMFFGWGLGLASNPQYMVRIISARDKRTAKRMIVYAIIFLTFFYFILTQIGLGMKILFPGLSAFCSTDDLFVHVIDRLLYSPFSGFFLISIIGACVSTANSQLLLIGSALSYDVLNQVVKKKMSEEKLLIFTRVFIFAGGTLSLLFSFNPPPDTLSYGGDIWGFFSVIFAPLIYGALLWGKGTRKGAYLSFFAGLISIFLFSLMPLNIHWAFPATICSITVLVVCSLRDKRKKKAEMMYEG